MSQKGVDSMKSRMFVPLFVLAMTVVAMAQQDPAKPVLRAGISVKMAVSNQAVVMRDADKLDAMVVSVTADGKLFTGTQAVQLSELDKFKARTVYVKADARVPYQHVLTVLDALRGRTVVLLTAPSNTDTAVIKPPYGVKVTLSGR
jgi:biopolymer transport protein ExbD